MKCWDRIATILLCEKCPPIKLLCPISSTSFILQDGTTILGNSFWGPTNLTCTVDRSPYNTHLPASQLYSSSLPGYSGIWMTSFLTSSSLLESTGIGWSQDGPPSNPLKTSSSTKTEGSSSSSSPPTEPYSSSSSVVALTSSSPGGLLRDSSSGPSSSCTSRLGPGLPVLLVFGLLAYIYIGFGLTLGVQVRGT